MIDVEEYKKKGYKEVITAQAGFQESFVRSNVDFVVGGAAMGVGKSYAALLMAAEPSLDPDFRMVYIRRNIQDLKVGGSGTDEALKIYGQCATMKMSDNPRLTFRNGSFVDFTHMSDQSPDKVLERIRGWQYSVIYIDEGTGFEWSTVKLIFSRNRGAGKWTGKIRITCNPMKNHWLRTWLDWYIDPITGFPIPERDGVVRYFYIKGDTIKDVVFADTKQEVYIICKHSIDAILEKMNSSGDKYTYEDVIKSTTFYSGKLSDNKALLKNNPGYIGSVAAMGEKQSAANLQGNWNISLDDESEAPIPSHIARQVFMNDPQINGDWWVTADLADKGTDNFVALVWNGLHIVDIVIMEKSVPRKNAEVLHNLAKRYDIADSHIVFDGNNAAYMNDYIPDAVPFVSYYPPVGIYARTAKNLKAEAFLRMAYIIKNGYLSFSDEVATKIYNHQKLNNDVTVEAEFIEECSVVRFVEENNGKKRLMSKKEMNQHLGRGRSMDLLDPIAIRMLPLAQYEYGSELSETAADKYGMDDEQLSVIEQARKGNVFNDSFWA